MTDPIRSLDDLAPGMAWDLGTLTLTLEEVVDFAAKYDPQYFHLDAEAAKASIFGELVVSGLHTLSAVFGRGMGSGLISGVSLAARCFGSRQGRRNPAITASCSERRMMLSGFRLPWTR